MNKIIKRTLQGIVAAAIISGTYFGRGKDDFPPLYAHKTKDSYGINFAVYTKVDSGASINGVNLAFWTENYGKINGANITGSNEGNYGLVNGLELAFLTLTGHKAGDTTKIIRSAEYSSDINGLAIALVNMHRKLNGAQIGMFNMTADNQGVLLNVDYHRRKIR